MGEREIKNKTKLETKIMTKNRHIDKDNQGRKTRTRPDKDKTTA
jgi:hypothetical protein